MEAGCENCGCTTLTAVTMSHGDREPSSPLELRRLLGFGLLNAATGRRLADQFPAMVPAGRSFHRD
jgi:hypothetical protein